jgi:hypothetical protein
MVLGRWVFSQPRSFLRKCGNESHFSKLLSREKYKEKLENHPSVSANPHSQDQFDFDPTEPAIFFLNF